MMTQEEYVSDAVDLLKKLIATPSVSRNEKEAAAQTGYVKNGKKRPKRELYVHSVDEVERITGYDFFPSLPDDIESEVEARADPDEW